MIPPSFTKLRIAFPYKTGVSVNTPAGALITGNKGLVEGIGGMLSARLAAIYPDLDAMNACAIRLSYCLNRAGHEVGSLSGVRSFKGDDGYRYMISADEMITYMKHAFGEPKTIWDGRRSGQKKWLGAVTLPAQGLLGYDWQGRIADFGAGGHVDIGRISQTNILGINEIGTGAYFKEGPMIVHLWKCEP